MEIGGRVLTPPSSAALCPVPSALCSAHNAAYHGLAGIRAGVNMAEFHKKRSPDEFYVNRQNRNAADFVSLAAISPCASSSSPLLVLTARLLLFWCFFFTFRFLSLPSF